jgi:hypothetical protein
LGIASGYAIQDVVELNLSFFERTRFAGGNLVLRLSYGALINRNSRLRMPRSIEWECSHELTQLPQLRGYSSLSGSNQGEFLLFPPRGIQKMDSAGFEVASVKPSAMGIISKRSVAPKTIFLSSLQNYNLNQTLRWSLHARR